MFGYIYKTTNLINGKVYIGQHRAEQFDRNYIGSGSKFLTAVKKYGKKHFVCELLEECLSQEELNEREEYYITKFDATNQDLGYNLSSGGANMNTDKQREAVSKYMKNRYISNDTKLRMSESAKERVKKYPMPSNKGKVWVTKDNYDILVSSEDIDIYINQGYLLNSRTNGDSISKSLKDKYANGIYMYLGSETIVVDSKDVDKYIANGYKKGKSPSIYSNSRNKNVSKGKKGTICITDGVKNYYIKPENWPLYENKGYYKCSFQKLTKQLNK